LDQELHRSGLLPRGARLLVAVSGGADSVALLRLLQAINGSDYWGWTLVVGHVDHGIRGEASAGDARFVEGLARELGLLFLSRKLRVRGKASEAVLREGRWKALAAMAKKARCVGIVTAHHADDQAETVLMRMMRGCGVDGLRGIPAVAEMREVGVYRPLLNFRGADLREYLKGMGQAWREDETNALERYTRNRVRSELLPLMESMYPGAADAIRRLAELAGETWEYVAGQVQVAWMNSTVEYTSRREIHDRDFLRKESPLICGEVLRRIVRTIGGTTETADFERVREAVRIVQGSHGAKNVEMGGGVILRVERKWVEVERVGKKPRGRK